MKKGISPLIATVLIIGFTILLASLVMLWGREIPLIKDNYCHSNPSDCVCEICESNDNNIGWTSTEGFCVPNIENGEKCSKYRYKTEEEKQQEEKNRLTSLCNNIPYDFGNCECLEYNVTSIEDCIKAVPKENK